ncbi:hypothetical protein ACFY71_05845 [Streptomyces cinerochromogenes]|uniref:hypothetical protein n=1 Tax=Streptomyces cinerochromogenes TaxID=66422 RepID=UPI00367AE237
MPARSAASTHSARSAAGSGTYHRLHLVAREEGAVPVHRPAAEGARELGGAAGLRLATA